MKKNSKGLYLAAGLLFVLGFGYLVWSGMSQGSVYFVNVSEALAMEATELSHARMFGTVADRSIAETEGRLGVAFLLEDKENKAATIPVDYRGAVPDTFKPGVEVIVEGGLNPATGVFSASTLMTKCPSKYEKDNRG